MIEPARLLIATNNQGKLREYTALLVEQPFLLISLAQAGLAFEIEETASSMEENAVQKASAYAMMSGLITLADDSGLEVDALGGEPGPFSHRYAGEGVSDSYRNEYLLQKLQDVPREKRGARFRCVIAIATPWGGVETCEGVCEGVIAFEPKGAYGFGYDPVFHIPELGKRMAELTLDEKNMISHRARAAQKAQLILRSLIYQDGT